MNGDCVEDRATGFQISSVAFVALPVSLMRVRFMVLGQATIAALETANPSDARERGAESTKNHETRP